MNGYCEYCNKCPVTMVKKGIKAYKRWVLKKKILKQLHNGTLIIPPMPDTFEEAIRQVESGEMTKFK